MKKALLLLIAVLMPLAAVAEPIAPDRIRVIDGDTIRIDGQQPDHRLVGFNAPEMRNAETERERELGGRATARLREIVRGGELDYAEVQCSCRPGSEDSAFCNFGRKCGILKSRGEDVGAILIREGLAVPFICGPTGCPPAPNPWR